MEKNTFLLKGNFVYAPSPDRIEAMENGFLVCDNGKSSGIFQQLPERYVGLPVKDFGDCMILPGMVDLHVHAPQYPFRGIGMDKELLDWLNAYVFPEEAKYADLAYAQKAYRNFAEDLRKSATTRAVIFGTIHPEATDLLMEQIGETGIAAMIGKVNMDRNSPSNLCETTEKSLDDTERWICRWRDRNPRIKPIITPRFVPSCTDALLEGLGRLAEKYHLPVQSHLSENRSEVAWVKELCPETSCYGEAYSRFGLFGGERPTIMAHGVHCLENEKELMRKNGVFLAHCPDSNMNLSSGIAPVKKMIQMGIPAGLGSDVAGGTQLSILRQAAQAIQVSKLRWAVQDPEDPPLTVSEAFYLATKGGGSFFGKVGSFEPGFDLDAVVLDDTRLGEQRKFSLEERLERLLYLSEDNDIQAKFAAGNELWNRGPDTWQ